MYFFFFFQAEDGILDRDVTGVQTCALPIYRRRRARTAPEILRAELLRASDGGAERGPRDESAGHRRVPLVQRLEAIGEPGPRLRPLWPAEGGDAVAHEAIRCRPRERRHPLERRQRRSH